MIRRCLIFGMGLLVACTATKLKHGESRSISAANTIYSDSGSTNTYLSLAARSDQSAYDAIWWLKGDVHLHPDSGLSADEAWIQLKGRQASGEQRVDSAQYRLRHTAAKQQLTQEQLSQTQKEKESRTALPWWVYILVLLVFWFIRPKRKRLFSLC